ncbi:3-methyl-2-oxobutanoate hydroxymethyltransferase [Edaphobacter flagellatus]|uniref:3-methyl-2-oxobutanoate hydroxymethyltransferase n=1 Tax=Edaphobacter flagellatus TaxID=1933044 RepID=UPI0021B1672E|nr:3-methyl-2-oxobutanoate hydroxymethyltransferase [Edaphobacter flagellatus]
MSLTQPQNPPSGTAPKITASSLLLKKQSGQPITALTAYDYSTARFIDEAGIDVILVGDSLGMTVLGYENTLPVTMEEMLHHAHAVGRGARSAFLVGDMPYGSYHASISRATENALRFIKEAGMAAIKIEGGASRASLVEHLTSSEVAVVGHIGLTPQSLHRMGGYKVQGISAVSMETLLSDALSLEAAGAVALVLEGMPRELAARITRVLKIPTIGIGAGPDCDGQILVFHDLFNLTFSPPAKFVRRYADASQLFRDGIARYREDVCARTFPSDSESYHLPGEVKKATEDQPELAKA